MDIQDLLISTKSLLVLQQSQAKIDGREFTAEDAMIAARPALEALAGDLLALQQRTSRCASCGNPDDEIRVEDLAIDNYNACMTNEVLEFLQTTKDLSDYDYLALHKFEKRNKNRAPILSKIAELYGSDIDSDSDSDQAEISNKVDKMFDDLFNK